MFAGPAVVGGCYTTPPPRGSPAQRSAARADGAAGERGRHRRLWPGGQLWDPINYVTLGCRFCMDAKRRGGCREARAARRLGWFCFLLAVPKRWGCGTANPLTHMSLLPRARWARGRAGGQALQAHAARAPSRRTQAGTALCNSLSGKAKVSDGGIPGNTMARALRARALQPAKRNKAPGSHWRVVWKALGKGEGRRKRRVAGIWGKKKSVWVFSDDVMELAENTSLLLECKQ